MGSLESGTPVKRDHQHHLLRPSTSQRSISTSSSSSSRSSRFIRFLFSRKIKYLQLLCAVAVFFFFVVLFQLSLPGYVSEKSRSRINLSSNSKSDGNLDENFAYLKEIFKDLDFGEDVKFEPSSKLLSKLQNQINETFTSRRRFGRRKPKLALVFPDLLVDSYEIQMVTIATALKDIGYEIEVYSLEDGPVHAIWTDTGFPVNLVEAKDSMTISIDWLNYDGILVNSVESAGVISCLMQEPIKSVPLIWTIHERALAIRIGEYISSGQNELVNYWRKIFSRASAVIFPNYILPMVYSVCDAGNYYVVPGSPAEAWEADKYMALHGDNPHDEMNYSSEDFVIVILGHQLLYKGLWLEQALVLQEILPLLVDSPNYSSLNSHFKIIVVSGHSTSNYSTVVETIALNLKYPRGMVKHVSFDEDVDGVLNMANLVIYGSFREEQTFPDILLKAMCFGKPIIAPDLFMIKKYIDDRVNGYMFSKENMKGLKQIMSQVVSNGKLSVVAQNVALLGKRTAKDLMVLESVEGYASLLENILRLPSEVAISQAVTEIPRKVKAEWKWHLFEAIRKADDRNETLRSYRRLDNIEMQWNHTQRDSYAHSTITNETFLYEIWEQEKHTVMANTRKRREDEELKDRTDQSRGTWEEVYRNAKRADRSKNDLRERDEGELERTGQPLCIYEPYFGEGTWPFLHRTSLYRGLGLSTKGRRPGADDIDAPSRLPLLNNPYYRDILGEYGAFFAIANRIDRVHRNAWIGFQSWRATARKESLSKTAERSILDAIQGRRHGDALYFWARMDMDPRNPLKQDFWSFCDAINAGNCQNAFSEAFRGMYGIKNNLSSLPPMPVDGDSWSVMHSWVLPTKSFVEFVMFSRMFVDSLDSQFYDEHHQSGHCQLSLSKDKYCYSRVLELLINVWAYHSGRRIVYVNPATGLMQEQHKLKSRKGQMWIKWFQFNTLKSMDEDLAEEFDSDHPKRRWIWPSTGEVFWQGIYEKEKNLRNREKEKRRQQSKDKISRIRKRARQKTLGKYVKPPPEEIENSNSTTVAARLLR